MEEGEDGSVIATTGGDGAGNVMATAFQQWRTATSPSTSANASPSKNKGSDQQEDKGSNPVSDPPSRRVSIEKVGEGGQE